MDTDLAILKDKVAMLTGIVEGMLARSPAALPPPPKIIQVDSSGNVLDWNGTSYIKDSNAQKIILQQPAGQWGIFRPQSQHWELLTTVGNAQIGVLLEDLDYGTTVGAQVQIYQGAGGHEQPSGTVVTAFPWKLLPGDVVPAGTPVDLNQVNGLWYVRNAGCAALYYTSPAACGTPCSDTCTECTPACFTINFSGTGAFDGSFVIKQDNTSACHYSLTNFSFSGCAGLFNMFITLGAGLLTLSLEQGSSGNFATWTWSVGTSDCSALDLSMPAAAFSGGLAMSGNCGAGNNSGPTAGTISVIAGGC